MAGFDEDASTAYKVKKWGINEGSEHITTGYSLRGRCSFKKAVGGLKESLVKGDVNDIDGIKFRVLDTRKNGVALDIEIEMIAKGDKGIALVKLYGPYERKAKKDNVVMITKSKQSDSKFVTILAEQIIKPLITGFLDGETTVMVKVKDLKKSVSIKEKLANRYKCPHCDKRSHSKPGLKGHITKMHVVKSKTTGKTDLGKSSVEHSGKEMTEEEQEQVISKEANKVVDQILNDILCLDDEEDLIDVTDVTLEEESIAKETEETKEYSEACDVCDEKISANKKYIVIRNMAKHKAECHGKSCCNCDFKAKTLQEMRRHTRDLHGETTSSTSPPTKRKRRENDDKEDAASEGMEVEDNNDVSALSNQLEEMDIDVSNNELEEETLNERSKRMDERIMKKEKQIAEEESKRLKNNQEKEDKKAFEKLLKVDKAKNEQKLKKQKSKDKRKKLNKRNNESVNKESKAACAVPNLKSVPQGCRHLVNEGDVVYVVPGDGACCPNCAAAFFFHDEVFGPKLRMRMNQFFVKHWKTKYQSICPCSQETPFVRMTSEGEVSYNDPEELFKYLLSENKKTYSMWSDCVDLVVIADLYQVDIKVITIRSQSDKNPTVNWIYADKNMEKFAELKNVKQNDMVLLHEEDSHYNLIISKDSDLARLGSLSFRFNVGPMIKESEDISEVNDIDENVDENDPIDLKKELKKCREEKKLLQSKYLNCEKELRNKTEEVETLKSELKDLKEIVHLEKLLKEENEDITESKEKTNNKSSDEELLVQMKRGGLKRKSPQVEACKSSQANVKNISKVRERQYNCNDCDFQGTKEIELNKHINLKHRVPGQFIDQKIKCRNCGDIFTTKWNLMTHRKKMHMNTVAFCRNKTEGNCDYSDDMCWWNHNVEMQNGDQVKCYVCNKTFERKTEMMKHRKKEHSEVVMPCRKFQNNECRFQDDSCWFIHVTESEDIAEDAYKTTEENMETESGFQKDIQNPKPPLRTHQKTKKNSEKI